MRLLITRFAQCFGVYILILGNAVIAQEVAFKRLALPHGITIEIPTHWAVLSQDTRKNIAAAGKAMAENAGIDAPTGAKDTLLAVNATPEPTGAMIRVSVTSPAAYTQADLKVVSAAELREITDDLLGMFRKAEASGGPKVIEMQQTRIENFNGQLALVMQYVRTSKFGPSPWQVTQYKVPVSNKVIEVTLSHRQSDALIWRPIIEKVRRSVRF